MDLENKFFFHLDKFSKACDSGDNYKIISAFEETAEVWKDLKKNNMTKGLYKDHSNATELFNRFEEYIKDEVIS